MSLGGRRLKKPSRGHGFHTAGKIGSHRKQNFFARAKAEGAAARPAFSASHGDHPPVRDVAAAAAAVIEEAKVAEQAEEAKAEAARVRSRRRVLIRDQEAEGALLNCRNSAPLSEAQREGPGRERAPKEEREAGLRALIAALAAADEADEAAAVSAPAAADGAPSRPSEGWGRRLSVPLPPPEGVATVSLEGLPLDC